MEHRIQSAAHVTSFEIARDALANGYGITTAGSQGYSSHRDENGVSVQQGSWSHGLTMGAADDRDIVKQKYGEPLAWSSIRGHSWNSGGTRILGTTIDISPGAFWVRWSQFKDRYMAALSSLAGWPAETS